jgi:hypothetical protein
MQKGKKKALMNEIEYSNEISWNVTRQFVKCIDETDFDKMHKVTNTVYGFVDNPAIMPDIYSVIDKLCKNDQGKTYTLEQVVCYVEAHRNKLLEKTGLIGTAVLNHV